MSNLKVRDDFRAALTNWAAGRPFVFYDSINKVVDSNDDYWLTAEFYVDYKEPLCIGMDRRIEHGTIDVTLFGDVDLGDSTLITASTDLELAIFNTTFPTFEIVDSTPAQDQSNGDIEGRYYMVQISFTYREYS